jgi:hypothetical protein
MGFQVSLADWITNSIGWKSPSDSDLDFGHLTRGLSAEVGLIRREFL